MEDARDRHNEGPYTRSMQIAILRAGGDTKKEVVLDPIHEMDERRNMVALKVVLNKEMLLNTKVVLNINKEVVTKMEVVIDAEVTSDGIAKETSHPMSNMHPLLGVCTFKTTLPWHVMPRWSEGNETSSPPTSPSLSERGILTSSPYHTQHQESSAYRRSLAGS
ncbi:hypothetical protein BDQ12DRAFT_666761 [Crucibulum laeve]|uniref:Uncharacterized protein n=1 Tax=Crucibulum laeve TaxID=68775 RepID=A0A5C3LYT6_9AGAR|nr:hypothetical protein BDQ12DRAFT_666761 [Crucibulum laeve]